VKGRANGRANIDLFTTFPPHPNPLPPAERGLRKASSLISEYQIASGRALLAADVVGRGDPIVFLHAGVCDRRMWREQITVLGEQCKAIAYDRRGFGQAHCEAEDYSAVADLMNVIDTLADGAPVILVGCSQGGRIALDAALMHPSRVRALVLIAPSVFGAPTPAYPPEIEVLLARLNEAEEYGDIDRVNAIEAHLWLDGPLAAEGRVSGRARELFLDMNGIALRAPPSGTNCDTVPAFQRLSEVTAPTLVIQGDLDFPHIQERSRHIATAMQNATHIELSGVAHVPSVEQPAQITNLISTFVKRLSR
jgi:pimeloyl-ACP methyl ester carboxylesterase